jgi:hypothetical protein
MSAPGESNAGRSVPEDRARIAATKLPDEFVSHRRQCIEWVVAEASLPAEG